MDEEHLSKAQQLKLTRRYDRAYTGTPREWWNGSTVTAACCARVALLPLSSAHEPRSEDSAPRSEGDTAAKLAE
jgi:hypothetical protein